MAQSISAEAYDNDVPIETPALEVEQPFGKFYVVILKARDLLDIAFVDELRVEESPSDESVSLVGSQRHRKDARLKEIAGFIETTEAAFPNSIILAANYGEDGELLSETDPTQKKFRWQVRHNPSGCHTLIIPSRQKLANIIDGQHRLWAFDSVRNARRLDMGLVCSVYMDLPSAYQGYIFATINFNQKSVNRSLAYQLYGLTGIEETDKNPDTWAPDRTAVFLSRKLTVDSDSPFKKRIILGAQNEDLLYVKDDETIESDDQATPKVNEAEQEKPWRVSTATVVDGMLKLFSRNPKTDRHTMFLKSRGERSRSVLEDDSTPLRNLYRKKNDLGIYTVVKNYFIAVNETFWLAAPQNSFITKTVGIQALFEVLNNLLMNYRDTGSMSTEVSFFKERLNPAAKIDFSENFFRQASGVGKTQIKYAILFAMRLMSEKDLPSDDLQYYVEYVKIENPPEAVVNGEEAI